MPVTVIFYAMEAKIEKAESDGLFSTWTTTKPMNRETLFTSTNMVCDNLKDAETQADEYLKTIYPEILEHLKERNFNAIRAGMTLVRGQRKPNGWNKSRKTSRTITIEAVHEACKSVISPQ